MAFKVGLKSFQNHSTTCTKSTFQFIITGLSFYEQKFHQINDGRCTMIPSQPYTLILDAAVTGTIEGHKALQTILITLTEGNINKNLNDAAQQQISKMMVAHMYLLINTFTNTIKQPQEWIQLLNKTIIAREDMTQGKIVVRIAQNNVICYTNMKEDIENMSIPQLQNYNLGLGTASNGTTKQQKLAKQCTQKVIKTNDIISVDASMNSQADPRTQIKRKIGRTGTGGFGGMHETQTEKKIQGYFHITMDTNDAHAAKLQGMVAAVDIADQSWGRDP